jgi:NAD(P)-dependent dehydrogenase (short-subunit alcohol dehydrogenase family)
MIAAAASWPGWSPSQGIRVNAVVPGLLWTLLNQADQTPEQIAKFGQQTSMHRPASRRSCRRPM